jgi:hypothetical protein
MRNLFLFINLFIFSIGLKAQLIGEMHNENRGALRIIGSNKIKQDCNLGDIVEAVFYIQNTSQDTVYIGQIAPDCQCTQYEYPSKGIAPNSTDSITLFFMSEHTPPGAYFKRNIVDYDDTSFELNIEGTITKVKNIIRAGQRPILYQKKQIRITNN